MDSHEGFFLKSGAGVNRNMRSLPGNPWNRKNNPSSFTSSILTPYKSCNLISMMEVTKQVTIWFDKRISMTTTLSPGSLTLILSKA